MMKTNKKLIIIAIILLVIAIIIGIATCVIKNQKKDFQSKEGDVVIDVGAYKLTYKDGISIDNKKIKEASSKDDAFMKEVQVETEAGKHLNLYLNNKKLDETYTNDNVKWEVYLGDEQVGSGTFSDTKEGENIELLYNQEIKSDKEQYKIYIWTVKDQNIDLTKTMQIEVLASIS